MTAFLQLTALRKAYPAPAGGAGTEAVRGVDLACARGELVVLLGPSGCGKTTTLRMMAGLETVTSGRVELDGRDVTRLPPQARDVGFVFQFYALYPHLSVYDNIAFPLHSAGLAAGEVRRRVESMVRRLGLEPLVRRRPRQLSGGDQQRVAVARALVREPQLWLMDEPLGTLDGPLRVQMREQIRAQQLQLGITTVYVTHDQEEAMSLADRIVVMDAGQVRQVGPPAEVYDRPADLFVAGFIGAPGMNFVRGRLRDGPQPCLSSAGLSLPVAAPRAAAAAEVSLGVRPEFVRPESAGPIDATVVLEERLGSHCIVHLDTPVGRLSMRRGARQRHRRGETLRVGYDVDRVRLFDAATGRSLP